MIGFLKIGSSGIHSLCSGTLRIKFPLIRFMGRNPMRAFLRTGGIIGSRVMTGAGSLGKKMGVGFVTIFCC